MRVCAVAASAAVVVFCAAAIPSSLAAASIVPPDGKFYLGAWLNTSPVTGTTNVPLDSPTKFNERLGFNASLFQYAQNIPFNDSTAAPLDQVLSLYTDAIIEFTIYPDDSVISSWKDYDALDLFTQANIAALIDQIGNIVEKYNTRFLLRLMPEMNGNWMPYGQRPVKFVEVWQTIFNAIQQSGLAGNVDMVWAPNPGLNYPYGGYTTTIFTSSDKTADNIVAGMDAEFTALDTNGDGELDNDDDPYSPYWPGDDYVDWIGVSNYFFGHTYPWITNVLPNKGEFEANLVNGNVNLYNVYSSKKNKPFIIAEMGVAFHEQQVKYPNGSKINPPLDIDAGPGNLAMKKKWFQSSIANDSFWNSFPNVKAICLFEYQKTEELTFRNFQVTNTSIDDGVDIYNMFISVLNDAGEKIIIANSTIENTGDNDNNTGSSTSAGSRPMIGAYMLIFPAVLIYFIHRMI